MGGTTRAREHQTRADSGTDDFASLYRASLGHLVGFFRAKGVGPEESNDMAHETVLRTLMHLKRHGRTREDIGPLTRTIARNLLVERVRKAGPTVVSLSDDMDAADDAPGPSELALQAERREAVRAAMASLTPRHRRVIELWMQGRKPAEIARELGIKRNAADAILHRARRTLASRLGPRALWGGVVLTWIRFKTSAKGAAQQLASWSPDSAAAVPAGVSLVAVGIVAAMSLGSGNVPSGNRTVHETARVTNATNAPSVGDAAQVVKSASPSHQVESAKNAAPTERDIGVRIGGTSRGSNDAPVGAGVKIKDDGTDDDLLADLITGLSTVGR
jgi:RNA polymerase sigma-70 factor (ECF subfamily)